MANDIAIQNRPDADYIGFLSTPLGGRIGGEQDTLGRIVMGYLADASLSNHPELGPVNRQAMIFEARTFLDNHPEENSVEEMESLLREVEIEDAINKLLQELRLQFPAIEKRDDCYLFTRHWKNFEREKDLALQEVDPAAQKQRLYRMFFELNQLKKHLTSFQENQSSESLNHIGHILVFTAAIRRINERFRAVLAKERLDPSQSEQIDACFTALHQSQMRFAQTLGQEAITEFDRNTQENQGLFSFQRFRSAEYGFCNASREVQSDRAVGALWNYIKAVYPNIGGPPIAQVLRDVDNIRTWIHNANAEAVRPVRALRLENLATLPPEIGCFTHLAALTLVAGEDPNQKLTGFPEEMRSLQALRSLDMMSSRPQGIRHNLREIPPVIGELRALEFLDLSGPIQEIPAFLADLPHLSTLWIKESNIRRIPDNVWRHIYWNQKSFSDAFCRFLGAESRGPLQIERSTFGIDREQLIDIPFSLWLEEFEVSYLPIYKRVTDTTGAILDLYPNHGIFHVIFCPFMLASIVPIFSLYFAAYVLQALINLPLFFFNVALNYLVEPIWTAIRDEMELDRNIPRDPPAEQGARG